MTLSKLKLIKILTIIHLFYQLPFNAQIQGVVLDYDTKKPIPFINIYTRASNSEIFGTTTNSDGSFIIDFSFNELSFKHINYKYKNVKKEELKDSVFLYPNTNLLDEVVISGKQASWITELLYEVVKHKEKNYASKEIYFQYKYETYSLSDTTGYAFSSIGNMLIQDGLKNDECAVAPKIGIIKYKDNTAGCDFRNLQKIIYENSFIKNFNKKFIKNYSFQKESINDNNIITLSFKSEKYKDDRGFITIDTVDKAIIECRRISGTEFNVKNRTNAIYRNFAKSAMGFDYKDMQSEIYVKYVKNKEYYQLSESKIKSYISSIHKKKKREYTYFSATEAQIYLQPTDKPKNVSWITLPKPFYIGIEKKKDRLAYDALQKIPKKHIQFTLNED